MRRIGKHTTSGGNKKSDPPKAHVSIEEGGLLEVVGKFVSFGKQVFNIQLSFKDRNIVIYLASVALAVVSLLIFYIDCFEPIEYIVFRILIAITTAIVVTAVIEKGFAYANLGVLVVVLIFIYLATPNVMSKPCVLPEKVVSRPLDKSEAEQLVQKELNIQLAVMEVDDEECVSSSLEELVAIYSQLDKTKETGYRNHFLWNNGKGKLFGKARLIKNDIPVSPMTPNHAYYMKHFSIGICKDTFNPNYFHYTYKLENKDELVLNIDTVEEVGLDSFHVIVNLDNNVRKVIGELSYPVAGRLNRTLKFFAFRPTEVFLVFWDKHWNVKLLGE